ncbi:hypothetical protein [Streptomyces sp. UNOC14_S4]|uniref:hypothetical protein n=1 Tax=Streptomyces sp. UNOC14_S4 TaxID=2872340 RepID=UPI001E339A00|nr:hypothetical protein [Streptomyces sp. UNOC14_S4]
MDEVAAIYAGAEETRPTALIGEFRRTAVLVPLDSQGGLWTAEFQGIHWIHAFTDESALARFAATRQETDPGEAVHDWEYRTVLGARLLDTVIPAVGEPTGVALDVGGERPMMFPPVTGIVPEAVALDAALDAALDVVTDQGAVDAAHTDATPETTPGAASGATSEATP